MPLTLPDASLRPAGGSKNGPPCLQLADADVPPLDPSARPPRAPSHVFQTRPTPPEGGVLEGRVRPRDAYLMPEEGGAAVTVSMRVMSAGDGYKYLLKSVAAVVMV